MSTELRETAAALEEVAAATAKAARHAADRPVRTARRHVKGIQRRGVRAARKINRRIDAQVRAIKPEQVQVWGLDVDARLPEKAAMKGLHTIRAQARRQDRVGVAAKRTLRILNRSFKSIARIATRFEEASELTAHQTVTAKTTSKTPARRRPVRRAA